MPQYLVAIHHPDNFDPSTVTEETMRDFGALNKEMMAAGVRFFAGGLQPETKAKSLRAQPNGQVLITDGPYLEANEHVGGFWILEVADVDEALVWGRKAVVACRTPVEVRPFFEMPPQNEQSLKPLGAAATTPCVSSRCGHFASGGCKPSASFLLL